MRRWLARVVVLVALGSAAVLIVQATGGLFTTRPTPSPPAGSGPTPSGPAVPTLSGPPVIAIGRGATFDPRLTRGPTDSPAQSKVWFNDGSWWAVLLAGRGESHIARLDWTSQAWSDTGTLVDERPNARADCLWDGEHLYVASGPPMTNLKQGVRLLRFHYDRTGRRYLLDPDFPLFLTATGADDIVISKDSQRTLWLTYVAPLPAPATPAATPSPAASDVPSPPAISPAATASPPPARGTVGTIWGVHSGADDLHWSAPAELPLGPPASQVTQLAAVATGTEMAVVWSTSTIDAVFVARHADGAAAEAWAVTSTPVDGAAGANQGLSVRSLPGDPGRRLFVGFVNALDRRPSVNQLWPRTLLLVVDPDGTATSHLFGRLTDHHTRPLVIIDAVHRTVYMVAAAPAAGGVLYVKSTSVDQIAFSSGPGDPLLASEVDPTVTAPTTSKQGPDEGSGVLVLASDSGTGHYLEAAMSLGGTPPAVASASPPASMGPPPAAIVNDLVDDTFDPWAVGGPVPNGWSLPSGSGGSLTVRAVPSTVDHSAALVTADAQLRARACKAYPLVTEGTLTASATVLVDGVAGSTATLLAVRAGGGDLAAIRAGGRGTFAYLSGPSQVATALPYRLDTWYRVTIAIDLAAHRYDLRVTDVASGQVALSQVRVPVALPTAAGSDAVCFGTSTGAPGLGLFFDDVLVTRS